MTLSYIGIGSNLQNPLAQCTHALEQLNALPRSRIVACSPWYRCAALTIDDVPQPDYCNGVVAIDTALSAPELFAALKEIERCMGRKLTNGRWQPRLIDLDILLFGDECSAHPELHIPHPELHKRIFVLQPLCDIAPHLQHPTLHYAMLDLLKQQQNAHSLRIAPWENAP